MICLWCEYALHMFVNRGFVFRLDRKLRSLCFEIGARSIKTRQENSKHWKISDADDENLWAWKYRMSVAEGTEEDKGPSAKESEAVPVVKISGRVTNHSNFVYESHSFWLAESSLGPICQSQNDIYIFQNGVLEGNSKSGFFTDVCKLMAM